MKYIYIPRNAVQNTLPEEELPVHSALLTIRLENGSVGAFLDDMKALGLNEQQEGRYDPSFTFYDQGYSVIQPSLQNMYTIARLLLILSALLLFITCLLLSWFFAQKQKHSIGIYRMLGGRKGQAAAAVLVCALIIGLLGALLGAAFGHRLSETVGQTILSGDLEKNEDLADFRAHVATDQVEGARELTVRAAPTLSALAACGALLFPLLSLAFVVAYIGEEPRALLPQNKE